MSRLELRPFGVAALAVAAMILGACGAAGSRAPSYAPRTLEPPQDRAQARRQLAYYTRQLSRGRRGLGLDDRATGAGAALGKSPARVDYGGMRSARRVRERPAVRRSPSVARSAPPPKRGASPASPPPAVRGEAADTTADGGHYRRPRCPMPCRHARAICHAARRICSIADYLGEPDAEQRCQAARQDCQRARDATSGRCDSTCPAKPA